MEETTIHIAQRTFLEFGALGLLGILLDIIFKVKDVLQVGAKPNWGLAVLNTIASVIITGVVIYAREDIKDIYPITMFTAFLTGYTAQSIFRKIIQVKDKFTMPEQSKPLEVAIVPPAPPATEGVEEGHLGPNKS